MKRNKFLIINKNIILKGSNGDWAQSPIPKYKIKKIIFN